MCTHMLSQTKGYTAVELKAMGQAINKTVTIGAPPVWDTILHFTPNLYLRHPSPYDIHGSLWRFTDSRGAFAVVCPLEHSHLAVVLA